MQAQHNATVPTLRMHIAWADQGSEGCGGTRDRLPRADRIASAEGMTQDDGLLAVRAGGDDIDRCLAQLLDLAQVSLGVLRQVVIALRADGRLGPARHLDTHRLALLEPVGADRRGFSGPRVSVRGVGRLVSARFRSRSAALWPGSSAGAGADCSSDCEVEVEVVRELAGNRLGDRAAIRCFTRSRLTVFCCGVGSTGAGSARPDA